MSRAIFDERMIPSLINGFFTSRCTISQLDGTLDDSGQPDEDDANWDAVTGMTDIPCAEWSPSAMERRTESLTAGTVNRMALLAGEFSITPATMRAVIGSRTYNVLGSELPSHGKITRLRLELVTT